jgi:glycosyltransferase involved in cell wall biosynthesis
MDDRRPRVCLLGLDDLPVLSPEHAHLGAAGEPVQHALLARALISRGIDVSVVTYDLGQTECADYGGVVVLKAYRPEEGLRVLRFFHPRLTGVMAALKRADADAYYASCASVDVAQIAWFAERHKKRAVFRAASDGDCDPKRVLLNHSWERRLYEYGLRHVNAILVQSATQQQAMFENYGLRSATAAMFVEAGDSARTFDQRTVHALWVANFRPLKRPEHFIELARSTPSLRCRMIGAAMKDQERYFSLTRDAASGIPNVEFSGSVPYIETPRAFEAARVLVNTSSIEGFPNTFLQAWAHGVPVVSYIDPDGIIGKEGLGSVAADFDQLVSEVKQLSSDRSRWAACSARCRAYAAKTFSEEAVAKPYLDALLPGLQR